MPASGVQELKPQPEMSAPVFPVAITPLPWIWITPAQSSPIAKLFFIVTRLRVVVPLAGRFCTRIPPHVYPAVIAAPFPVSVVFSMSKAAPFKRMPPPGLFVTLQASM